MTRIAARVAPPTAAFQTGTMTPFTVEELPVPATIDAADATAFVESCAVRTTVEALGYGTDELALEPAELLPEYLDPENEPRRLFGVRVGGALVAQRYRIGASPPVLPRPGRCASSAPTVTLER